MKDTEDFWVMDLSSGELIVSSFQNKSNCGSFIIVISLFFYKKNLFHADFVLQAFTRKGDCIFFFVPQNPLQ